MPSIEDRWTTLNPITGRRVHTDRWGHGMRWRARWEVQGGGRPSKSFETREAAVAHIDDVTTRSTGGDQPLATFAARWQANQLHQRPSSREQMEVRWRLYILPSLGNKPIEEITRDDVQDAVAKWSKTLAPSTVSVTYGYLASALRAAKDDGLIRITPCRRIRLPEIERRLVVPLTADKIHAIAKRVPPLYRAMSLLDAATGMRGGELRGLSVDRVRFTAAGAVIRVDRQLRDTSPTWGPPKTNRSFRDIAIGPRDTEILRQHMEDFPPHRSGLIFTGLKHGPIARTSMSAIWHTATADMGLPKRSGWHEFRHFHASMLIAGGLSVVAVAARLGHEDPTETLRTYGHLWHDDESRMLAAVEEGLWKVNPQ